MLLNLIGRYLLWLAALAGLALLLKQVSEVLYVAALFLCLFLPTDRTRVFMLREGYGLPSRRLGWSLVVAFSSVPFSIGLYSGVVAEASPDTTRANMVILAILFWGMFTFGLNGLLYRHAGMWHKAQKRLTKSSKVTPQSGAL